MLKFRALFVESYRLVTAFFKPYGLKDETLQIPLSLRSMGLKLGCINLSSTVIALVFSFMLKFTTMAIEAQLILLGIICFLLYRGQYIFKEAVTIISSAENKKYEYIFENEVVLRAATIIGKVANRVFKFDENKKLHRVMANEELLNVLNRYIKGLWSLKTTHIFDILAQVSVVAMLIVAIFTNTAIDQRIFIPMIVFFAILSFLTSAYVNMCRNEYYDKRREFYNSKDIIVNDLLRVNPIVHMDVQMRLDRFKETVVVSKANEIKFYGKIRRTDFFLTLVETVAQYGVILVSLFAIEWNNISLSTITQISATLVIVETAMSYISRMARSMSNFNDRIIEMSKDEVDMERVLQVYQEESQANTVNQVTHLSIEPFTIKYVESSENDKSFELVSKEKISISHGEIVILSGASGSGKSTFMKMLTERIKIEKTPGIPSTRRFLFYDETLSFGSLSIFDELFCLGQNPNLNKMRDILYHLHLWQELLCNCIDVWTWMKEKQFSNSLSNGQKQRMILAKMLYWLDDSIDVVALDECTSGLDEQLNGDGADVERILEFVCNYCNKDKERIIIISTHQNLDQFKSRMTNYVFQNLLFEKIGEKNTVKRI